jgi:hypothetical protein
MPIIPAVGANPPAPVVTAVSPAAPPMVTEPPAPVASPCAPDCPAVPFGARPDAPPIPGSAPAPATPAPPPLDGPAAALLVPPALTPGARGSSPAGTSAQASTRSAEAERHGRCRSPRARCMPTVMASWAGRCAPARARRIASVCSGRRGAASHYLHFVRLADEHYSRRPPRRRRTSSSNISRQSRRALRVTLVEHRARLRLMRFIELVDCGLQSKRISRRSPN